MQVTLRILKTAALTALALIALACNGDNGPAPTAIQSDRTPTPSSSDETPTPRLTPAPAAKGWRTLAPMPTPRSEVAVAAVAGKIYVVGGFEGDGSTSDAVEVYDPVTDTWTQAAPLPEPRHHTTAAPRFVAEGPTPDFKYYLYVVGGYQTGFGDPQSTVFKYDPVTDKWSEVAAMPTARGGHALVEFTGNLYAIGGADADGKNVAAVEVYQVFANTWSTAADLPTPRDHLAAAATHFAVGSDMGVIGLYAIGGRVNVDFSNNLDANDSYKSGFDASTGIRNDAWEPAPPLPTARSGIAAASTGGRIYVFGGEGSEGTFDENEVYDARTNTWQTLEAMPTARHGLGAAVVGDTIYVIGGGETPGLSVSGANEAFTP